jgi:hypothetical protein
MFLSIMKFLLKGTAKTTLKSISDDPEVISAIEGIELHGKELDKQIEDFEKKYGKKPAAAKYAKFPWER